MLATRNTILLGHPLAAFANDGLAGRDWLANSPNAFLAASLDDRLAAGAAHFLYDALSDWPADGAAYLAVAALGNRFADRIAALAAMLLAAMLGHLVAMLLAVLLMDRPAHRVTALFPAGLWIEPADRVMTFFPASLVARAAAHLLHLLVTGLVARPIARLALVAIAGSADRLHHRFLNRFVTGMPPSLQDGVIHELVARAALLLARCKAALGVAARCLTTAVFLCAAVLCRGRLDSPEQAEQPGQQRRSQAHPHDFASSNEPTL